MLASLVLRYPERRVIAPLQRMTIASVLSSTRTTISSISVRMIRLRVAGNAAGLPQACSTSAPSESRRVRSVCVGAAAETANSRSNPCSSLHLNQARIPALFETCGNKTIVGVHRVVLPLRREPLVERIERSLKIPSGCRRPITSAPTARSMRMPPKEMQRAQP